MSTTPVKPSGVNQALGILSATNGYISIGIQVGELLIPLIKGGIKKIEQIGSGSTTVDYQVLITSDGKELDGVISIATEDLAAINAELVRLSTPKP